MRCSVSGRLGRCLDAGRWAAVTQRTLLTLSDLWGSDQSIHHLAFQQTWKRAQDICQDDKGSEKESLLFPSLSFPGFSVLYTLWMMFRQSLLMIILLRLSTDLLNLFCPFTLRWVLLFCERQPVFDWGGYGYVVAVLGSACSYIIAQHLFDGLSKKTAATAHAALYEAIYRKAVSLPRPANVLSAMSEELERMVGFLVTLTRLFTSPLRAALCLGVLWWELGTAVLVGGLVLILFAPLCSVLEHRIRLEKCSQVNIREKSENLLKEMLHGIKTVKLLALETCFQHRAAETWERELETLRTLGYLAAFSMLTHICLLFLVSVSSLGVFVLMDDGNVLMPSQVFVCLCFFRMLRSAYLELLSLPFLLVQVRDSLSHLEQFFMTEDLEVKNSLPDLSLEPLSSDNNQQHCKRCDDVKHCDPGKESEQFAAHKGVIGELRQYLRAFGCCWILLTLLTQLGVCVISVAQDGLLCMWTGEAKEVQGLEEWKELRDSRLTIYTLLGLVQALLVCWVSCSLCHGSLQASQALRSELISSVLHLPLTSHHHTDHTHLLHTLTTQGMYVMDDHVPKHLHVWGSCLLEMISTVLLITFIFPVFSLLVCPLTFLLLTVQSHFTSAQRQIRQTVSSEAGLCLPHQLQAIRQHLQVQYHIIATDRRALLKLDAVGLMSLVFITLLLLESADLLDSGIIALALAYNFNMRELMQQYVMTTAEIASSALTAQRIRAYTDMEKEAAWSVRCTAPPAAWPQHGELHFSNLVVSECCMSPAFNGLSFHVSKGEKIGVVSRDKSELDGLMACLFRAVEADSGWVCIDGVDISRLGLHTLRRRLHLISQEPVMFSGSLRANVDPFGRYSDAQVWRVLELCQLKEGAKLLHHGASCSAVLSPGQKRLLCLTQALLSDTSLLLVEEAPLTADSESEKLLWHLILTELPECTVLWLGQNPNGVLHTDRVLVLNAGRVVEFESPSILLQQRAAFSRLLHHSQHRGND